jgi:hypothetical protein
VEGRQESETGRASSIEGLAKALTYRAGHRAVRRPCYSAQASSLFAALGYNTPQYVGDRKAASQDIVAIVDLGA